jgi:4-methyl-5(b-hydroxyethyl)-thiazole monophosphate biosynthesis
MKEVFFMTKKVLVPISDGFEEIEALTIIDVLRRAGADVTVAGLNDLKVKGRSNVTVIADKVMDESLIHDHFDMLTLPGGLPNAYTLRDDPKIISFIKEMDKSDKFVTAICAAPAALKKAGVLKGHKATNYPGVAADLSGEDYVEQAVVESENIITSRGPGTAMEFALSLVKKLFGKEKAAQIAEDLLAKEVTGY